MLKIAFCASVGVVLYTYLAYPLLICLLAKIRPTSHSAASQSLSAAPRVTLIIPAHNEERWIRRKIENALGLDYPRDRLRILVASDGSTDRTVQIAQEFTGAGVEVVEFPERIGKQELLNRIVPKIQGEIVVMTDANALLQRNAVRLLVRHLADPHVGCVSGNRTCLLQEGVPHGAGEGMYWRYESWIKKSESRVHSCLGAHGQLYAVRREIFPHVERVGEDFYIPMKILATTKLRVIFEPQAMALIPAAANLEIELERKTRAHVSFLLMQPLLKELWSLRHPLWWQYVSHHVSRIAVPLAMIVALISSSILAESSGFYRVALAAQAIFYVLASGGYFLGKLGKRPQLFFVPFYFVFANLAIARALLRWPARKYDYAWQRTERLPDPG